MRVTLVIVGVLSNNQLAIFQVAGENSLQRPFSPLLVWFGSAHQPSHQQSGKFKLVIAYEDFTLKFVAQRDVDSSDWKYSVSVRDVDSSGWKPEVTSSKEFTK